MIQFSDLRWLSLGARTYEVANRRDFFSIKFKGTSKKIIRVDWTHDKYLDHTLLVGYLHGTVEIIGKEAAIFGQKIYLGSNLVIIPPEISTIKNFYLNHSRSHVGKFTLQAFEPTTQIVLNPLTNEPVILGDQSLKLIEDINELYSQEVIDQLSKKISLQVNQELTVIQNQVSNLTTILSSAI